MALLVEYDGTGYKGSQYQGNAPTVQGALERSLRSLTGEPIRVALAGRTDAGVHALGQVASFSTTSRHSPEVMVRGVNARLPRDVVVRAAAVVAAAFDPRRWAQSRWYRYSVCNRPVRPALDRYRAWHVAGRLDLEAMQKACAALLGRHDFAAFAPPSQATRGSTERVIYTAQWRRLNAHVLQFDIEGNAFLQNMVRRIVAALVDIGRGKLAAGNLAEMLRRAVPGTASAMAPAHGLYLIRVRYESGLFDDEANEDV